MMGVRGDRGWHATEGVRVPDEIRERVAKVLDFPTSFDVATLDEWKAEMAARLLASLDRGALMAMLGAERLDWFWMDNVPVLSNLDADLPDDPADEPLFRRVAPSEPEGPPSPPMGMCFTTEHRLLHPRTPSCADWIGPPSPTPSLPDAPSEDLAHPLNCFVPMCAYCEALRQRDAR